MKTNIVLAATLAVLMAVGGADAGEIPAGTQWGVTFGFYAKNGYFGSDEARAEVDAMKAMGVNWVTVVVNVWQDAYCSTLQYKDFLYGQSDLDLADIIDYIHAKGMKVQLRPMLECKDGVGRLGVSMMWDRERIPGRVCDYRTRWFESMRQRSVYYARIAERTKCEIFSIGSELDLMIRENAKWKSVVAAVRKVYSGALTSCHTLHCGVIDYIDVLKDKDHWFYDLDFLSISYYCKARGRDELEKELSVEDMMKRLEPAREQMRAIAKAYGKPLQFGECGCTSSAGGAAEPSGYARPDAKPDEAEQARYMEALFRTFKDEPWCLGFHWWGWGRLSPIRPEEDLAYEIRRGFQLKGKAAAKVFSRYARP